MLTSNNNEPIQMPKTEIVIPRLVHEKIMYFVNKSNDEVSGLGITKLIDGKIVVKDIILCKQSNGMASTEMTSESIQKAMFKLKDEDGDLNFWWHSHVNMGVFWSGTDNQTIAQIGANGMCVASVFNKKGEIKSAVACINPFPLFIDDVKTTVLKPEINKETIDSWDKEYAENVKANRFNHQHVTSGYGYGNQDSWRFNDSESIMDDDEWYSGFEGMRNQNNIASANSNKAHWDFAMDREEISDYTPYSNQFKLVDGTIVDADMYMNKISYEEREQNAGTSKHI